VWRAGDRQIAESSYILIGWFDRCLHAALKKRLYWEEPAALVRNKP
jgi:hypothetical protein